MSADVVLVNGSTTVRTRNSEGCVVLECGCAHTDIYWLQMCKPHFEEDNAYHVKAQEATRERRLAAEFT